MAIFETGAASTIPNLLNAIALFAVANGWTSNYNAVSGSGRRVHLQLGSDVFINLRALVSEVSVDAGYFAGAQSGLQMIGSTGYDAAQAWWNQPGYPYYEYSAGTPYPKIVAINQVLGGTPAYYLFARGNMIYVWLEYATGQYQWLVFGRIAKTSTWTGGAFFAGANHAQNDNVLNHSNIAGMDIGSNNIGGNPNAFMRGVIGADTGWLPASNEQMNTPMPKMFDTIVLQASSAANLANTFNGQPVLAPVEIAITRDGTVNQTTYTNFSIEGRLPDLYFCNMRVLLPGQQLDDGSGDVFRVLPFRKKNNNGITDTGWWGVAIKEN